jgi:hypothetical protein
MTKAFPIKCNLCGKLFLCKGRYNLFEHGIPIPQSKCIEKTNCVCDKCHEPNGRSEVCVNLPMKFNPSKRYTWESL